MFNQPYYLGQHGVYQLHPRDLVNGQNPVLFEGRWYRERRDGEPAQLLDFTIPRVLYNVNPVPAVENRWIMDDVVAAPNIRFQNIAPNPGEDPDEDFDPEDEMRRERERMDRERQAGNLALEELNLPERKEMPARIKLTPFKLPIETVEDLGMRFRGTVIMIQNVAMYCHDVYIGNDGKIGLVVEDQTGKRSRVPYDKVEDVRSPTPGYLVVGNSIGYLTRLPIRHQSQGLSGHNTTIRGVNRGPNIRFSAHAVCDGLNNRVPMKWSPEFAELFRIGGVSQARLCNEIAVYSSREKGQFEIKADYCGRPLGVINEDRLKAHDPDDLLTTWISKECNEVGLLLAA